MSVVFKCLTYEIVEMYVLVKNFWS